MGADVTYQLFETYYRYACEAEVNGRPGEAKKMYLMAAEALLKTARESDGETKAALVRRADKLTRLADCIVVPEPRPAVPEPSPGGGAQRQAGEAGRARADDQATTIWRAAGKPDVTFDDIAGLEDVKEAIYSRVILPRTHPEVYALFKRKVAGGILLYGPPGTGKTMIAKAVAAEVDADFFSVQCSDIVGKYFGEAEKNVRALFETARRSRSAVVFFDEFEALGAERGSDSGAMNRLVPELLSQMDGFLGSKDGQLMCLAATNRPWDIDSAFLRPPRLTEKIYVGLPDRDARLFLAERAFRDVPCEDGVDAGFIAASTEGYNAADVVEVCGAIKDMAIKRTIVGGAVSVVTRRDVEDVLKRVRPSVRREDIERIRRWEADTRG